MIENGESYIVNARFMYKDGKPYTHVYGKCEIISSDTNSYNNKCKDYFLKVYNDKGEEVIVPLTRVDSAVKCEKPPVFVYETTHYRDSLLVL